MFNITADQVLGELRKISFFLQYSDVLSELPKNTRNKLTSMPIEWEKLEPGDPIVVSGNLEGKPFLLKINKTEDRNTYVVEYDGNTHKVATLNQLKRLVEDLKDGNKPITKKFQEIYNMVLSKKTEIHRYALHFLGKISKSWRMNVFKGPSIIRIRFFLKDEDQGRIESRLPIDNINSIGSFIKQKVRDMGLDVDEFKFSRRYINLPHEAGFLITIRIRKVKNSPIPTYEKDDKEI